MLLLVSTPAQAATPLFELINARLELMKSVAAYKWVHKLPIENLQREEVVIGAAVMSGLRYNITAKSSRSFFQAQIEAAKDIQACWFKRWSTSDAPTEATSLDGEIRPALIDLGNQISEHLAGTHVLKNDFDTSVVVDCLSEDHKRQLFNSLSGIETYPDRLTQIKDSGLLRIGTTGDYEPFSSSTDFTDYEGIDIDLGRDLAGSLGVKAVFVQTGWPRLSEDLKANQFDIAMSGVSIIPARQELGFFSQAYYTGGKTPISLCIKSNNFNNLDKIDRTGIRVIVNPGGTNEKFLNANLKHATRVLHEDNRTIFDAILSGNADLMITDAIEVQLQSAKHPELCPTMPGKLLTSQDKGYWMPKDKALQEAVVNWLTGRLDDGTVEHVFRNHLGSVKPL